MKRLFDIFFSIIILLFSILPWIIIGLLIKATSKGAIIYYSDRVGKDNVLFRMPKFRSMFIDTPEVATDKLSNPDRYITPVGKILRKTSLDEIPQLFSVLKGDMSFVGPRPALFNQHDLIEQRKEKGIDALKPGITGWAQINGRDNISNEEKVKLDEYYLNNNNLLLDFKIILNTALKVFKDNDISH